MITIYEQEITFQIGEKEYDILVSFTFDPHSNEYEINSLSFWTDEEKRVFRIVERPDPVDLSCLLKLPGIEEEIIEQLKDIQEEAFLNQ